MKDLLKMIGVLALCFTGFNAGVALWRFGPAITQGIQDGVLCVVTAVYNVLW